MSLANFLDIQIKKIFNVTVSSLILMSSWLISSMDLSLAISSEITAKFSVKIPCKQINTLKELLDTKMSLIVFPTFINFNNIEDKDVLEKITNKIKQEHSEVEIIELIMNKKYVVDVSEGRSAIFLGGTTVKMLVILHSKHFGQNTKFRFLDERFRNTFLFPIAISTRLPKQFRRELNSR